MATGEETAQILVQAIATLPQVWTGFASEDDYLDWIVKAYGAINEVVKSNMPPRVAPVVSSRKTR